MRTLSHTWYWSASTGGPIYAIASRSRCLCVRIGSRVGATLVPRRIRVVLPPISRRHTVHSDLTKSCPRQSQRFEANARSHTANLTVLAFAQRELEPRPRNHVAIADRWM